MTRNRISQYELEDDLKNDIYAVASTDKLGKIKVDGTSLTVDPLTGVASVIGGLNLQPYTGNADDLVETGFYSITGSDLVSRGFPLALGTAEGLVQVFKTENGFVNQFFSYGNNGRSYYYVRGKNSGSSWGVWERLMSSFDISPSATSLYVDGLLGTDSPSNGTSQGAGAYKTITYAISRIPKTNLGRVTINLASGTYSEAITISGFNIGEINLSGATSGSTRITGSVNVSSCDRVTLSKIISDRGFDVRGVGDFTMSECSKPTGSYVGLYALNSKMYIYKCDFSNSSGTNALTIGNNSSVYLDNVTGTGNAIGISCIASVVRKSATTTITGSTAQQISGGGQILS